MVKMANGTGYAKLYAYDLKRKVCLLERLGKPINQLEYSIKEQLEIICNTLKKAWEIPVMGIELSNGKESVEWFRGYIGEMWEKLEHPCSEKIIDRAFSYLQSRENAINPSEFVLVHGDAHGGNTLKTLSGDNYKLIDPDGIFYEKAYDLGVLMREWREEYHNNPVQKGKERCKYLSELTGVEEKAIFEWGFLQCVSTGMVFWNINRNVRRELLNIAESWCAFPLTFIEKREVCPTCLAAAAAAHEGDPGAIDAVLSHYTGYIGYCSKVHGKVNAEVEEHIKQQLIAALFKFCFDR